MRSRLFTLLFAVVAAAQAQEQPYHPYFAPIKPGKEIFILRGHHTSYTGGYYTTSAYNDIFNLLPGADQFFLPDSNYYRQKKVAQVKITGNDGSTRFILDMNKEGRAVKSTLIADVLHEDQFFYDETGRNIMTVKSYSRNNVVLRMDTVRYSHQKKVINDTIYTYTAVQLTIYKSGSFLNEQNQYYNKKYSGVSIKDNSPFAVPPVSYYYYVKSKGKGKGKGKVKMKSKPSGTIYVTGKYPVNYPTNRFYFSYQHTDVENDSFIFGQQHVNPGEEALRLYMPEFLLRDKPKYGDLPCEQFQEPRFMQTSWVCGSGLQRARESQMMEQSIHYTYSENNNQLHDTCYTNSYGNKSPLYSFSYSYFE
jgi:hypothetical protein